MTKENNEIKTRKRATKIVTREIKKFHITYTQFLAIIFALLNTINLLLIPMGQYGIIPPTPESYVLVMFFATLGAFLASTVLYKLGMFQEAAMQIFDLQESERFIKTSNWGHCNIAQKIQMSPEDLADAKLKAAKALGIEKMDGSI